MTLKLREKYKVQFDAIDFTGKISLNGICSYMQIIAANHASILGFNYYKNSGSLEYYWILSRVKYVIDTYPEWEDTFEMETYPAGYEKLFAVRMFDIYNDAGKKIGYIIGDYVLMDAVKMRPTKIKGNTGSLAFLDFPYEGESLEKLKVPKEEPLSVETRKAFYSEMDLNEHMNNSHYVRWVLDMLPIKTFETHEISSFEINYNASVTYGVEVKVSMVQDEKGNYVIYGNSQDEQTNYFVSRVSLRKKQEMDKALAE